jgi:hypothetical protein
MNDYYPFLLDRVSQSEGSGESRRKTYESVREDLFTKLARPGLRVPEAEIAAERRAFDAAIQKIEADLARDGAEKVGLSRPPNAQPSPDFARTQSESAPALLAGEAVPEVKAPTMAGTVELVGSAEPSAGPQLGSDPDRTARTDDFRVLPRDAFQGARRASAVPRSGRRRLLGMMLAIVVCGLVFAATYFSASVKALLGP